MIDTNMFDFVINDEDEVMLLLYVREGEPENATFAINFKEETAELKRNETDQISLHEIPSDILDSLNDADKLLVCELTIEEDETKTEIVYAYEAEIID